ncbi:unnamed protein product [Ilex paraguariensis]|uniref:Membrane-associated kinase regulator 2 n=1 Tax=Ilex paraguariensis TaxID=185542 RepID=A0ABC8SGU0_9AQUA
MEAFSLLKYWRGGGGNGGGGGTVFATDATTNARTTNACATTTIVTAVSPQTSETDTDDDGPFFDLEFAVPDEEEEDDEEDKIMKSEEIDGINCEEDDDDNEEKDEEDMDSEASDGESEEEFKFTLSSGSSANCTEPNVSLSPSDDLFFKGRGRLVPVEPLNGSESNSKSQFPASLLRSATKLRVSFLMLKLKKSKPNAPEKTQGNGSVSESSKPQESQKLENQQEKQNQTNSKFFTVKFKVEEVPIMSLFTRDSSSKGANNKAQKQNLEETASDDKRFSKDVVQKYLKMVKPLYVRVSKRYGDKLRFSGQLSLSGVTKATAAEKSPPAPKCDSEVTEVADPTSIVKNQKQGNLPAGLRVVRKHLGKSRSSSSAVAAAPSGPISSKRRDDSLLQQQDGIQSAILHCKRSFNASRDSESSILSRSVSDPSHEKCGGLSKNSSSGEGKEKTWVAFESTIESRKSAQSGKSTTTML